MTTERFPDCSDVSLRVITAAPAVRKVHRTVRGAALNTRVFLMIPADRSCAAKKVLCTLCGVNAGAGFWKVQVREQ